MIKKDLVVKNPRVPRFEWYCKFCGRKEEVPQWLTTRTYCSKECMSLSYSQEKKGIKKSKATRQKMSQYSLNRSETHKQKLSSSYTEDRLKNHSKMMKEYWTPERKMIRSQQTVEQWASGIRNISPHNRYGKPTIYKSIWMRSGVEARTAKLCDAVGLKWVYPVKRFNLGITTYQPDFYLPEFDIYLEVKWGLDDFGSNLWKVDLLRQQGKKVIIVEEKEIKQLEKIYRRN